MDKVGVGKALLVNCCYFFLCTNYFSDGGKCQFNLICYTKSLLQPGVYQSVLFCLAEV